MFLLIGALLAALGVFGKKLLNTQEDRLRTVQIDVNQTVARLGQHYRVTQDLYIGYWLEVNFGKAD